MAWPCIVGPIHSRFWPLWPQTGNCQLWPFWQLHIETLDSEPRQGPDGICQSEASLAIASLDQNGTTHWHLPLWPQLAIITGAQSGCHMVIYGYYYFLNFYTKMRRLDGSRVVPGIIPAPLLLRWYGMYSWFHFFLFCHFYQNYLFWNNCFFRWLHVVPVVFGSFILTCYLEPSWFPFFKILSPCGETNDFATKLEFFDVPCGSPCFRLFYVKVL